MLSVFVSRNIFKSLTKDIILSLSCVSELYLSGREDPLIRGSSHDSDPTSHHNDKTLAASVLSSQYILSDNQLDE